MVFLVALISDIAEGLGFFPLKGGANSNFHRFLLMVLLIFFLVLCVR